MFHFLLLFCTVHWADPSWPTFHYWLYPVWLCMWRIIKNLEKLLKHLYFLRDLLSVCRFPELSLKYPEEAQSYQMVLFVYCITFWGLHVSKFDFCGKIYIQEVIGVKDLGVVCLQCFLILMAVCPIVMRMRSFTRHTETFQTSSSMSSCIVINSD